MDENPFTAPLADEEANEQFDDLREAPLASRWARLGASLLDTIILVGVVLIVAVFIGFLAPNLAADELMLNLIMITVVFIGFVAVNGALIYKKQQTVGKLALGIKVVRDSGDPTTGHRYLWVRWFPWFIIGQIPVVGSIISLIDVLFIFRGSKKCLHDDMAGTIVVKCRS